MAGARRLTVESPNIFISVPEIARRTGLSQPTVRRRLFDGTIHGLVSTPEAKVKVLVLRSIFEEWAAGRRRAATSDDAPPSAVPA